MGSLADFFARAYADHEPIVAAWVIATEGSTYRKTGALMLFTRFERCGLLSGGCLEGDLHERARQLLNSGEPLSLHRYDSRGSDDPIWGLGLGCEGLMQVLLLPCTAAKDYEPVKSLLATEAAGEPYACAIDLTSGGFVSLNATGSVLPFSETERPALREMARARLHNSDTYEPAPHCFSFKKEPPPSLLICGAGPDVEPVVFFAHKLGWQVDLVDHRPAYIDSARFFVGAQSRLLDGPAQLPKVLALDSFSAALVMSHHLQADGLYLTALADSTISYIGLLGPAARRERLFAELGPKVAPLRSRLRAPVGLDLGAQTPEEIALAIVAEIQASLRDRTPRSFTTVIAHPNTK
jgi:xanthine dehydrogenase accessory factor